MIRSLFLLCFALAAIGCSDGASVSGDVTYEGKPVKKGYISFIPADGQGPTVAAPISDGHFSVSNVRPGPKIVKIEAADNAGPSIHSTEDMKKMSEEMKDKVGPTGIISTETVPADAIGNNATFEVKSGSNTQDFPLKKPETK
jgi:hypothetical protein